MTDNADDDDDDDDKDNDDYDDDNDDLKPLNTSKRALNTNPPCFWDTLYVMRLSQRVCMCGRRVFFSEISEISTNWSVQKRQVELSDVNLYL